MGHPPPVLLFLGDEALLVQRACAAAVAEALEGVVPAFNHSVFRAGEERAAEALAVARTLPMMSPRRVVELRGLQEGSSALFASIKEYLASPSPSTVLVMSGTSLPPEGRGLDAHVKKVGVVERYAAKEQDPIAFARHAARELGVELNPGAARVLVETVGRDLGRLQRELEKASLYLGGSGVVDEKVVAEACSLLAEAEVWDLTDGIVLRSPDRAMGTCLRLLQDSPRGEAHRLLGMVAWQLRQMLELQEGKAPRMPPSKAQAMQRALRERPLRPARILRRLAQANQDMNGHRAGEQRVLEGLLLELVSSRD